MEPEAFLNSSSPTYEFIYNNESQLEPLQYPLSISRFKVPRFANELYSDNSAEYFTYSGSNSVIITKEKEGRYKNLTLKAYSGDSFKFYFQVGSGIADSDTYFSGPLTTSGVYSTMTVYTTQSGALANAITFSAPTNNSSVYTLPTIQNLNWVRLYHSSVSGTTPYRIYQFLPRTLIQVDDLEADVIDAVTLRVSSSIVVSADDLAPGSITGEKIMLGTISGVLITPGTITANEISAGTITATQIAVSGITANRLNVTQLDAVAANMGQLIVNSGISIGTNGTIWAGSGPVATPTTGLKIYTTGGVSRLTTYDASTPQVDIGSDGKLTAGAGNVTLDSTGISIGTIATANPANEALRILGSGGAGNIVGMAFYNGSYSAVNPQITIQADSTNALEIENNALNGITNFNFPASGLDYSAAVNIYNANLHLVRSPVPPEADKAPGALIGFDSDGTIRYKISHEGIVLNNNTADTFTVDSSTGHITTSGRIDVSGNLHVGAAPHVLTVNGTSGNLHIGPPPHVFIVNGTSGNTTISGNLSVGPEPHVFEVNSGTGAAIINGTLTATGDIGFGTSNNKVTIAGTTGNTLIAGTLGVTGAVTTTGNTRVEGYLLLGSGPSSIASIDGATGVINTDGNITSQANVFGSTVTATTDLFGEDTLNVANDGAGDYRFKVSSTGKLTSDAMGYITARRTADVAITTAGTTIVWNNALRSNKITVPTNSSTITITNAGYYMFSATFATLANLTSLRMTLQRGGVNYVSTLHGAGLSTGGGYLFNFNIGFFASAGSTYTVILTPSANTTLNANGEGFAGPSPLMNIFQAIGV